MDIELFISLSAERLMSFDLDGTLDFGDPPGPISAHQLKKLKEKGVIIGGASGKESRFQVKRWRESGVKPHFVIVKVDIWKFKKLKTLINASEYIHIGDAPDDEVVAKKAGFNFLLPEDFINWYKASYL
jgi:phosphoglycolate phosphatase-like HAD superfamily hydrolase